MNEDTYEGDIKSPLSLNLYTYVSNNPLTNIDPTGYCGVHYNSQGDYEHVGCSEVDETVLKMKVNWENHAGNLEMQKFIEGVSATYRSEHAGEVTISSELDVVDYWITDENTYGCGNVSDSSAWMDHPAVQVAAALLPAGIKKRMQKLQCLKS